MKRIYLIDISSFIFRAFYAIRPLTSPAGLPTNAVYGVISMLIKLLKEDKPEYVVVCYDRKEPSFRKELFEAYKANRSEMPEDLVPQMPVIKKAIELMGIPAIDSPGYEADDIIGTLAKMGRCKYDLDVMIVSGDKDFGQTVEDRIFLVDTMKGTKMGPQEVFEKWGVHPHQFIDYLALVGDSSDNIPGVTGIGPKGAVTLLSEYQTLEGIYENLDKIKSASLKTKLETGRDMALLSKKLVTIVNQVPVSEDLQDYHLRGVHTDELRALLKELNFKAFEKALFEDGALQPTAAGTGTSLSHQPAVVASATTTSVGFQAAPQTTPQDRVKSILIQKPIKISELPEYFKNGSSIWVSSSARGIFVSDEKTVYCLEGDPLELGKISDELQLKWRGFDLKSFFHQILPSQPVAAWDSMLGAYLIKPGESMEYEQVMPWLLGRLPQELPSPEDLIQEQLDLAHALMIELEKSKAHSILADFELPLIGILYQMERRGILLDRDLLAKESQTLGKEIHALEIKIHEMAGTQFNIASPKQLSQILFEKLRLSVHKKTKTGYSTDNEVLEKLRLEHPIADELLQYRELTKLKSTYVDSLPLLVKEDGRIHTTFNQALTATGRLSSTDPNLQNIPIKTERGARVRRAFVAQPGSVLLSVDYSQIELRILAHYSEDKNLIKAFEEDLDIHAATASEVFGVGLKDVTPEMRRTAKAVNFGIAYGQGAFGLAETLGIPRSQAQDIIKKYFARFSGVKDYIDTTIEKAKETGFVETIYGRRRYMTELRSNNPMIRKFGERAAINAPIQGSASDIVKKAMIEVYKSTSIPMLLQVHDELIFEDRPDKIESERAKIVAVMEGVTKLRVPLKANSAVGVNWDEAH
jgi:DNA polymerase-1